MATLAKFAESSLLQHDPPLSRNLGGHLNYRALTNTIYRLRTTSHVRQMRKQRSVLTLRPSQSQHRPLMPHTLRSSFHTESPTWLLQSIQEQQGGKDCKQMDLRCGFDHFGPSPCRRRGHADSPEAAHSNLLE